MAVGLRPALLAVALASALAGSPVRAEPAPAVDALSYGAALQGGRQGGFDNAMALGRMTAPLAHRWGVQVEAAAGLYRQDYTSLAVAAHLFRRDPERGLIGIYSDWAYVNPEHLGRIGVEGALYLDRFTLDILVGVRSGTNVFDRAFDEIDATWYFGDRVKASIGHRGTARGQVGNLGVEYAPRGVPGLSLYAELEAGEDDNESAVAGLSYTFRGRRHGSLMARDRRGQVRTRIPRNIVDVTRCGALPETREATFGFREMNVLCASRGELQDEDAVEGKE